MHFNTLATTYVLAVAAVAVAEPAPYKLKLGAMSLNSPFGLSKRQAGYQPTQTICGAGDDCPTACGPTTVQCASNDGDLHCYDPSIKQTCCPNLSGYACDEGYYCTQDASDETWCCPNGMNLAECAAAYSLTGSLMSQTASPSSSAAPSSSPSSSTSSSAPASVTVTTSSAPKPTLGLDVTTTVLATSTTTECPPTTTPVHTYKPYNYTTTTSAVAVQFTGAANSHVVYGGLPALALAAGALLVL